MDYIEQYKTGCRNLAAEIRAFLKKEGKSETYFCVRAGAHQAAMKSLDAGTCRPNTVQKLRQHLARQQAEVRR